MSDEINDIKADVEFTLSAMGRERREDREILYAEEIMRLRHEMRRVIAEREEARISVREWLPIEYAPRDGTEILVWNGVVHLVSWVDNLGFDEVNGWMPSYINESYVVPDVTHWMPLPEPPKP